MRLEWANSQQRGEGGIEATQGVGGHNITGKKSGFQILDFRAVEAENCSRSLCTSPLGTPPS